MPIHDWTRVDAGLFHDFHQSWTVKLRDALNTSTLPSDYFALVEQNVRGPIADVLTLQLTNDAGNGTPADNGRHALTVATAPPKTRMVQRNEVDLYAERANRITVRHRHGEVVAVIEIVSPGNKSSRNAFRTLVEKSAELIRNGVHLLVIDLFPPGPRDPQGVHKSIWEEFSEEDFMLPADKRLTLVSYDAGPPRVAYVEPVAVGDALRDMPLFLEQELYVHAPLESTYLTTWDLFPDSLKGLLK